jgi:hypothetical protein
MAVFVSYSSRDRALLEGLLSALRRAHEQVWLDEELGGGEAWWREILDQIRGCEVFVVALSENMLESRACQSELQYAQELGKPILPVQVGPLASMRINPLAAMQVIDYRDPSIETGIELVSNVHARRAKGKPLPDPLPEEPSMPFAYLMRLASTISGSALSAQQQTTLVAELKAGLEEDGDDATARRDITQLLCALRDRADVTWRTRTEVESVLAALDSQPLQPKAPAGGPPPPGYQSPAGGPPPPGYQPPPGGPPPAFPLYSTQPPRRPPPSRRKWILAGSGIAVAAVVAVVVVVLVMAGGGGAPTPAPAPVPTLAPSAVGSVLLTAEEVDSIVGTTKIEAKEISDHMTSDPLPMSNPNCVGAFSDAVKSVYEGSGYTGVSDQVLLIHEPNQVWVNQTAVTFPSADQAGGFLNTSANKWNACAGQTVTITFSDGDTRWTFGEVSRSDSQITQVVTEKESSGWSCQHTLRSVSNVVIEALACDDHITDEASRLVEKMAAKLPA